ncbi:MAG: TRAP transporter TatT component family protein [Xanthomonadales bacterium]|nr:TRAP transporter TatT component family protein [Xanthomonadales bacterium]
MSPAKTRPPGLIVVFLAIGLLLSTGCSTLVSTATDRFAGALSAGILNQDDLDTVRDGMPAYLLLVDGFIIENPQNSALLLAGAELYSSYSGAFTDDPERARRLADRAREYGIRALCSESDVLCEAVDSPHEEWVAALDAADEDNLAALYGFAASWATWIELNSGDWDAIADIPKVEAAMRRVIAIDPDFRSGWPQLYLGVLTTQLPPAFGGKPEVGREFFDTALAKSKGQNLMVHVLYAQQYARLVFNQALHDQLLQDAIASDVRAEDLTLINVLAQQRARRLLSESKDFF